VRIGRPLRDSALALMMLSMAGCSHLSSNNNHPGEEAHRLTAAEFARVRTTIHPLPEPLQRALAHYEMLRMVPGPLPQTSGSKENVIRLSGAALADDAIDVKAMQREILLAFFRNNADRLNLFCDGQPNCHDLPGKKKQLTHSLRGSYLHPFGHNAGTANADLVAGAYAFHATEYFVDATYRCRHPLIATMLESVWEFHPEVERCSERVPFLVTENGKANAMRWVDPARVYAVHLLFAGEAGSTMSRFGHLSLRIIHCNEDRAIVDQRCEQDLFDHISMGFKANIDEIDLSLWKGVMGGYALKLYAQAFMDTYREYSIDEFRPMYSLPLVLSDEDKRVLVTGMSEIHWSYQNDYKFFTQNCATEVQWLLNAAVSARQAFAIPFFAEHRLRPDRLFSDAKQSARFNVAVLLDLADAEKSGHYFPSTEKYYQTAIDTVRTQLTASDQDRATTPDAWMAKDAPHRRAHWLMPALARSSAATIKHIANAGIVLEEWVARKSRRRLLASLISYYGQIFQAMAEDKTLLSHSEMSLLSGCVSKMKTVDTAGMKAQGIPQRDEKMDIADACDASNAELVSVMKELFNKFPPTSSQEKAIRELELTVENLKFIAAAALH
jgi:Domain of unknown function (DUF4105)